MILGNLKIEAYFEVLYPLYVVDSLRTLKVHHCLSLVTIGSSNIDLVGDPREFEDSGIV